MKAIMEIKVLKIFHRPTTNWQGLQKLLLFSVNSCHLFLPPLTESADVPYSFTSIVEVHVKPGKIRLGGRGSLP